MNISKVQMSILKNLTISVLDMTAIKVLKLIEKDLEFIITYTEIGVKRIKQYACQVLAITDNLDSLSTMDASVMISEKEAKKAPLLVQKRNCLWSAQQAVYLKN